MVKSKGMNSDSRTVNSIRNISSGVISQIIYTIFGFVSRTIFIKYLAVEYLGINGLFTSILSVLAFAELGVGSAFVYSLYKPLAEKNEQAVAGILQLYKKVYTIIGAIVFTLGLLVLPFLDQIIPETPKVITESIRVIYLFFLFNAASTYFFSYKVSLLNADQRNYVTNINYLIFYVLQNSIQILVLIIYQNFLYYLATQLLLQFLSNVSISIIVNRYYPFLKKYKKNKIDKTIRKEIVSNAKATLIIKIGGIIVNNTDNLIINYFSGLVLVGLASNYNLLIAIASALILQIFNNISSSIAQVNAKESKAKQYETFKLVNLINLWVYGVGAICFIMLANDFILLWIGDEFLLPTPISLMLAINFFMIGVQGTIWTYKTTYGLFNQGKYLIILTAILNLGFSFLLGSYYGLFGILMATALSRILTNFAYDPYIIFKLGLKMNPLIYLKKFLIFVFILVISGVFIHYLSLNLDFNTIINLFIKLLLSILVPSMFILLIYRKTTEYIKAKAIINNTLSNVISKIRN